MREGYEKLDELLAAEELTWARSSRRPRCRSTASSPTTNNDPGALFDWYEAGDVEIVNAGDLPPFHLTRESADYWTEWIGELGCLVVGRTLFDITDGWTGEHPLGVPFVVLTHEAPDRLGARRTPATRTSSPSGIEAADRPGAADRRRAAPSASPPARSPGRRSRPG